MWAFTIDGFYSAVEHRTEPGTLIIRCRDEGDARRLHDWLYDHVQPTSGVEHTPTADYGWRLTTTAVAFGQYLTAASLAIDYANFKDMVAKRQGQERAHIYGDVWATLLDLQYPND